MTVNYLPATTNTFKRLQTFNSLKELNESIKVTFENYSNHMTNTTKQVLGILSKYSIKYLGVSFLSKQSIADMLKVNIRTVRRAVRQLEDLGIVKSYRLKRVTGDRRESSSCIQLQKLISVLPYALANKQNKSLKNNRITIATEEKVKSTKNHVIEGLISKLPKPLHIFKYYFNVDEIYKYTGIVFRAKSTVDKSIELEDHSEEFEITIKQVIQSFKLSKIKSFEGVLYNAIKALCKSIWIKKRAMSVFGL